MLCAYDKSYVENARRTMAHMLDHAVYTFGMELREFYELFLISSFSKRFESGDCSVISGRSGWELAHMVLEETGHGIPAVLSAGLHGSGRSPEYWSGWALAYFQWESGLSFSQIQRAMPVTEILSLYPAYHELDIRHFCDKAMEQITEADRAQTRLKYYRKKLGLSQSRLAEAAEIPVRTIQQYEQRRKNINHAQAEYLIRLSRVLGCSVAELAELEKNVDTSPSPH